MSRPNLFTLDTWGRHENSVLEAFQCALVRLRGQSKLPEDENDLNRILLFHVRSENYRLINEGRGCRSNVYYESRNQPIAKDEERAARERKRPDFTWGLVDAQAGEDLFLVIECKRLGQPSSPSHVLNRNYTTKGVQRFMDPEIGYGEGAESGAMIGYLQTMSSDDILEEVNGYADEVNVPPIGRVDDQWIDRGVTRLGQELHREVDPSPFRLVHLWVDLRRSPRDP